MSIKWTINDMFVPYGLPPIDYSMGMINLISKKIVLEGDWFNLVGYRKISTYSGKYKFFLEAYYDRERQEGEQVILEYIELQQK